MELRMRGFLAFFLFFLFSTMPMELGWCGGHGLKPLCREEEREALLGFKRGVHDPSGRLSSWAGDDCCQWEGVGCHNSTGHVLKLDLRRDPSTNGYDPKLNLSQYFFKIGSLGGEISASLVKLKHLRYLDLSCNSFGGLSIPKFLGSISSLRYLNLSAAGFGGLIPPQLGNLSKLHYLDIGEYDSYSENSPYVEDLEWISGLTHLKFLGMEHVNLSKTSNWLQVMNKLPFLSALHLSHCGLHSISPLPHVNFSSLAFLDLSHNYFVSTTSFDWFANLNSLVTLNLASSSIQGSIPSCLQNMTSLVFLDLSDNNFTSHMPDWLYCMTTLEHLNLAYNKFEGKISNDMRNLTFITYLDLSYNGFEGDILTSLANVCVFQLLNLSYQRPRKALNLLLLIRNKFTGPFPDTLRECRSLKILDLRMNHFSGQIPVSLGGISSLSYLNMRENFFEGVISEKHLVGLTSLQVLDASSNLQLTLQVSSNWTPPFQLRRFGLGSCMIGPQFPAWLQTQKYLTDLNMSYAGISSAIPAWFWTGPYSRVDLSHNQIIGNIPTLHFQYVYLSSNNFTGALPQISSYVGELELSNNLFHGSLSPMLCRGTTDFVNLLMHLDVSNNRLSGELPDCWMHWTGLARLNLGENNLTGSIPSSMGSLTFLNSLHLRKNRLSGNFPLPLKNCTSLLVLDLSENEFTGSIPAWLGNFYAKSIEPLHEFSIYAVGLKVLVLHSNKFNGSIPDELCRLDSLQILDLGNNNLSGTIPRCFGNFSGMSKPFDSKFPSDVSLNSRSYIAGTETATVVVKGEEYEYGRTLRLLTGIDLSSNNKLSGEIPEELTALHGLIFLNLSNNHLQGKIPHKIGGLTSLESLDLSMNSLSGAIPQSLATISFLSHLNLSYNNLSGKIPSGTQIQGFSPLSFMGNPELCGPPPLSDNHACPEDMKPKAPTPDKDADEEEDELINRKWLYFGMAWGFVVGFWGILGPLALNRTWRHTYFQRLHDIKYKLFGWWL